MIISYSERDAENRGYSFPITCAQLNITQGWKNVSKLERENFSSVLSRVPRMLTAQALVAPISSNIAPRSQVIKDKVITVTTRNS